MAGTDINIARPIGWTGYVSSVPWGGTANNVMGGIIGDKDLTTTLQIYAQMREGRTERVMKDLGRGKEKI